MGESLHYLLSQLFSFDALDDRVEITKRDEDTESALKAMKFKLFLQLLTY